VTQAACTSHATSHAWRWIDTRLTRTSQCCSSTLATFSHADCRLWPRFAESLCDHHQLDLHPSNVFLTSRRRRGELWPPGLWPTVAICGQLWPSVASVVGHLWPAVVSYGQMWPTVVSCGLCGWPAVVSCGQLWSTVASCGLLGWPAHCV
jgi:hypothetical protein